MLYILGPEGASLVHLQQIKDTCIADFKSFFNYGDYSKQKHFTSVIKNQKLANFL